MNTISGNGNTTDTSVDMILYDVSLEQHKVIRCKNLTIGGNVRTTASYIHVHGDLIVNGSSQLLFTLGSNEGAVYYRQPPDSVHMISYIHEWVDWQQYYREITSTHYRWADTGGMYLDVPEWELNPHRKGTQYIYEPYGMAIPPPGFGGHSSRMGLIPQRLEYPHWSGQYAQLMTTPGRGNIFRVIIVEGNVLIGNNGSISADGETPLKPDVTNPHYVHPGSACMGTFGSGGGGGGGLVLICRGQFHNFGSVTAKGGNGGDGGDGSILEEECTYSWLCKGGYAGFPGGGGYVHVITHSSGGTQGTIDATAGTIGDEGTSYQCAGAGSEIESQPLSYYWDSRDPTELAEDGLSYSSDPSNVPYDVIDIATRYVKDI